VATKTLFEEIVKEAEISVKDWPHFRDTGSRVQFAFDLLVIWSRIRRFLPTDIEALKNLDQLVRSEIKNIYQEVLAHCESFSADAWFAQATELHRDSLPDPSHDDSDWAMGVRSFFHRFDEVCMAINALCSLVPAWTPFVSKEDSEKICKLSNEVFKAQKLLEDHLDQCNFLQAGGLAIDEWNEFRNDLITSDFGLWKRSLHLRIVGEYYVMCTVDQEVCKCFPGQEEECRKWCEPCAAELM
jgi:hypothetical protein